jgi:hypothetical protein
VSCCAAASACGIAGTEFDAGIDFKPVPQKIDLYGLCFLIEFFFHDKLETIYIEYIVSFIRLIQSHGEGRPASTTGIQKDPNRRDLFAFKVFFNLLPRFLSYFNHIFLSSLYNLGAARGIWPHLHKISLILTMGF